MKEAGILHSKQRGEFFSVKKSEILNYPPNKA